MEDTQYHKSRVIRREKSYKTDGLPSRYVFVLTNKCNLSCSFCFQDRKKLPNSMDFNDWVDLSNKLPRGSHVTLTGGEPLAFKNFDNILKHIADRHTVNIICNGVLLTEKVVDLLCSIQNVRVLSISVDTIGNVNRGVTAEQYDKMKRVLGYFHSRRRELNSEIIFDTKTVVTDQDSYCLFDIYKHCIETLKADTHSFQFLKGSPIQHSDKMFEYGAIFDEPAPHVYQTVSTIAHEFEKVRDYCIKNGTRCFSHPKFIDFSDKHQNYEQIINERINKFKFEPSDYKACKAPWESVHINADGAVFPCLAVSFGDARQNDDMNKLFNQPVAKNFRNELRNCGTFQACHRCGYLEPRS